ncbi:MAG: O-antigen ligase family protein [Acidobacteriaceae bacterium]
MNESTLSAQEMSIAEMEAARLERGLQIRKYICMVLLAVGFWFATPYSFPWSVQYEKNGVTTAMAAEGNIERQIALPLLALLACYMLWRFPSQGRFQGRLSATALVYCGWLVASLAWSVDPSLTAKRMVVFLMNVLIVVAIARTFTALEMAEIGYFSFGVVALLAVYCDVVLSRTFAPMDPNYRFTGVMNANPQGMNLTTFIFCGLTLLWVHPRRTKWIIPSLCAAVALLYWTRSRTAFITCMFLSIVYFQRILRERYRKETLMIAACFSLAVVVPVAVLIIGGSQNAMESAFMMGRNDTQNTASLSNRAPLWSELSEYAERHLFIGQGYDSFWTPSRIDIISAHQGWSVPNAHDTYLDETLSLGIIGAALYAIVLWPACGIAWVRYRRSPSAETLFLPVMLTWLILTSFVESVPPDPFLPTILVYACLAKTLFPAPTLSDAPELLEQSAG